MQTAQALAEAAGAAFGTIASGANAAGAWLAGAVPHRGPGGQAAARVGRDLGALLDAPPRAWLLLGVEPDLDCAQARRLRTALVAADFVVALSGFERRAQAVADVILPQAVYGENEGSFVNFNGLWQPFTAAVPPRGERARRGRSCASSATASTWRVSTRPPSPTSRANCRRWPAPASPAPAAVSTLTGTATPGGDGMEVIVEVPMYRSDALVRHAPPLSDAAER